MWNNKKGGSDIFQFTITICVLAYYDYKYYRIPNVIINFNLLFNYLTYPVVNNFKIESIKIYVFNIGMYILLQTLFFLLSKIVKFYAGDRKLIGLVFYMVGFDNGIWILFVSLLLSLYPLSLGIKKIPMALFILSGYIAFYLLKINGSI